MQLDSGLMPSVAEDFVYSVDYAAVRSMVPKFTAVPSWMWSAARRVPSTISSTYVQLRICSPVPQTMKGSCFMKERAIIAMTAWSSFPRFAVDGEVPE